MLDTYVVNQLNLWAAYRAKREDNGLGWPKKCSFDLGPSSGGFWTPAMESSCYDVDRAVCALIPERKDVVMKCYTVTATIVQKAKMCGITDKTYNLRLTMAHRDVLGFLNDLACGIPLPNEASGDMEENSLVIVAVAA